MKLSVLLTPKPTPMIKDLLECMYESIENAVEDYEILFSTADLSEKSIRWFSKWKNARPIYVENRSRAHFWNVGFKQVSQDSDLILFLDLDSILFQNSVRKMIELLEVDSKLGAVGSYMNSGFYGVQQSSLNATDLEDLANAVTIFEDERVNLKTFAMFLEGNCMLIRREILSKIQSRYGFLIDDRFSKNFYDDIDLSVKILLEGFFIEVAPTYVWRLDIENSITDADKWNAEENFQSIWGFSPRYSFLLRMEILQLIPDLTRDGIEILEVGCAAGGTLYVLRSENPSAKLYGIEINSGATRIASMFAEVENIDVEKIAPDHWQEKFDYIICGDVIEHLVDPWTAIRNMRKMLKPGGHLLASIPNVANIVVIERLLNGHWDYKDAGILDRTHLRFFTMESIVKMVQSADFQNLEIIYKRLGIPNHLLRLAEEFSERFNIALKHFTTFQYIIDATK